MRKSKTVIMVYNIKTEMLAKSFYQDEWQIMVWANDFLDTHIWFIQEE